MSRIKPPLTLRLFPLPVYTLTPVPHLSKGALSEPSWNSSFQISLPLSPGFAYSRLSTSSAMRIPEASVIWTGVLPRTKAPWVAKLNAAGQLASKALAGPAEPITEKEEQTPGAILAFEMGLGKTFISIAYMSEIASKHPKARFLVVAPPILLKQWQDNLEKHLPDFLLRDGKIVNYRSPRHMLTRHLNQHSVVLTTYDTLRTEFEAFNKVNSAFTYQYFYGGDKSLLPPRGEYALMVASWHTVILDEVSKAANPDSLITQAIKTLLARFKVGITGTPLPNDYDNIYSLLRITGNKPWDDREKFNKFFVNSKGNGEKRARRLEGVRRAVLATKLRSFVLPLSVDEKFNDVPVRRFPEPKFFDIEHELTPVEHAAQASTEELWDVDRNTGKMIAEQMVLSGEDTFNIQKIHNARVQCVHLACRADGNKGDKARDGIKQKTRETWQSRRVTRLLEMIKDITERKDGKIIVFCDFRGTLSVVENALEANEIGFLRLDGAVRESKRADIVERFQALTDERGVLLMTKRCGGMGLNLTAARHVFLLMPAWSPADDKQAVSRAVRVGQTKQVSVYRFFTKNSIERHVRYVSLEKEEKAVGILDPRTLDRELVEEIRSWNLETFKEEMRGMVQGRKQLPNSSSRRTHGDKQEFDDSELAGMESQGTDSDVMKWDLDETDSGLEESD
ncbi:P-loop containing nucleoside triphosphate hydrolase protein [Lophiostoma macrostomum CBS 122681]|uniref:P-loop containing nucleoside triphosphate hydrolase protein n=1 Tax=Lophiostoma macrostomum CBS 122681 TaxID=1314788 RepID=A0A6A6TRU2_9PLEO|nr:P-loop containing nucleoside triphosphate hydrolase protein [Lophiostoma macrostomum CBS 122681]